ncbi:MAG: hypothetical protein RMX35_08840 [Nostoc sp. DcaGUA01]|nr:hypothetical protein [Nostoc sp. DcaGUA01]
MIATIQSIIELFTEKGSQLYGAEAVSQLEHALQCATLAQKAGESNELVKLRIYDDQAKIDNGKHSSSPIPNPQSPRNKLQLRLLR